MPNLRGRKNHEREQERGGSDREAESDEEFNFGLVEEAEGGNTGHNRMKEPESAEQGGDEANKGEKAKTKTWSNVVKGLKPEDELEISNLDKSGNESETSDSVRMFDSEMPSETEGQAEERAANMHQHRDNKGVEKGRRS